MTTLSNCKNCKFRFVTRSFGFVDNTVLVKKFSDKYAAIEEAKKVLAKNKEVSVVFVEYFNKSENMFFPLTRVE
jgi:hypothetical protein